MTANLGAVAWILSFLFSRQQYLFEIIFNLQSITPIASEEILYSRVKITKIIMSFRIYRNEYLVNSYLLLSRLLIQWQFRRLIYPVAID